MLVAEERADRIQARLGQRLEEGAVFACVLAHPPVRLPTASPTVLPTSPELLSPPPPPPRDLVTSPGTVLTSLGTVGVLVGTVTDGSSPPEGVLAPVPVSGAPPPPSDLIDLVSGFSPVPEPDCALGLAAAVCCDVPEPAPAEAVAVAAPGVVLVADEL